MPRKKTYWRRFAGEARQLGSPLYERLALAVDGDPALKALAARARPRPAPGQYPVRGGAFSAAAGRAASACGISTPPSAARIAAILSPRSGISSLAHEEEVTALVETRVTNTNEVARSCVLRAGFAALAAAGSRAAAPDRDRPQRRAQHDLGPLRHALSPGRCGGGGDRARCAAGAGLRDCGATRMPPLAPAPVIASRIGLELQSRRSVRPGRPRLAARAGMARSAAAPRPAGPRHRDVSSGASRDIRAATRWRCCRMRWPHVPPREAVCVYHTIAVYQFSRRDETGVGRHSGPGGPAPSGLASVIRIRRRCATYALTLSRHDGRRNRQPQACHRAGAWRLD